MAATSSRTSWRRRSPRPTSSCCPTTRATRSPPACSSKRSLPASPWSPPPSRMPGAARDGPGIVVAHEDPTAIAEAVRSILTEQGLADRMRLAASMATAETTWADVALRYRELATDSCTRWPYDPAPADGRDGDAQSTPAPRYGHLQRLTDGTGVFEHARFDVPRRAHGYCVDDVARALLVAVHAEEQTDPHQPDDRDLPAVPGAGDRSERPRSQPHGGRRHLDG